jgi:hypothetical protein
MRYAVHAYNDSDRLVYILWWLTSIQACYFARVIKEVIKAIDTDNSVEVKE